jgi:hypothetical protein
MDSILGEILEEQAAEAMLKKNLRKTNGGPA